jgi:hypothetical protein
VSAVRNRANSFCGSNTTWKNWSLLIPSSRSTVRPTSSILVSPSGACPLGAVPTQTSDAFACCFVVPPPRFFARKYSGLRTNRSRCPRTVSSSRTSVTTPGSA